MKKGLFITFEGGEGVGKSTQIKLLQKYLAEECGLPVCITREPGGSVGAEEIRNLLLKGDTSRWDRLTELLLFSAARRDHLVKTIWPAIERGEIVLSDRFADSTLAYQCFGYGFDETLYHQITSLSQMIAGNFKPDITFILDLDAETGLMRSRQRAGNDEQRFEEMQLKFHQNLRNGFLTLAEKNPEQYVVIDASCSVDDVHQQIVRYLSEKIAV